MVRLPNRKVEALLAILALNRQYGMERKAIAEILWPLKPEEGMASLRQALSLLRRAIGDEAVCAPRGHCQLSQALDLVCDHDSPGPRASHGFMPGHEGDWFDSIRLEEDLGTQPAATREPTSDFERTLEWLANHSPSAMYGVMREAINLTQGIPAEKVLDLVSRATSDNRNLLWREYWLTYMGDSGVDLRSYKKRYERVLSEAMRSEDYELAVEVGYSLGASLIVQGGYAEAERTVAAAQFCAARSKSPQLIAKAGSIGGVLLIHKGKVDEGRIELQRSECTLGDTVAIAQARALRAFLETSSGLHHQALETAVFPMQVAEESGHTRLKLMCSVAKSHALACLGSSEESLNVILPIAEVASGWRSSYFWPYAYESATKAYLVRGDDSRARKSFLAARSARVQRGMPYISLDRRRISRADVTKMAAAT